MSSINNLYAHDAYHDMVSSPEDVSQAIPMNVDSHTIHEINPGDMLPHDDGNIVEQSTMVPGNEMLYANSQVIENQMTAIDAATILAAANERRAVRPAYKLSVKLIDTYKTINKIYYENKARRQKEQQTEPNSSSSAGNARSGVNNDGYDDNNYNYLLGESGDGEIFNNRYVFKYKIGSVRE